MSATMTLKGAMKFSMKKLIAGGDIGSSTFTGPGELILAPPALGDISNIRLSGQEQWNVGKDAFLAATQGVVKDYKSQGIGKAMFSGEGLFVYKISGNGILWITSLGAIIRKDVSCFSLRLFSLDSSFLSFVRRRTCPANVPAFPSRRWTDTSVGLASFKTTKNTSSTTAISWRGTASTCLNAPPAAASCRVSPQPKD